MTFDTENILDNFVVVVKSWIDILIWLQQSLIGVLLVS